jgi:hypothetical protein
MLVGAESAADEPERESESLVCGPALSHGIYLQCKLMSHFPRVEPLVRDHKAV